MNIEFIKSIYPARNQNSSKKDFGSVLLIGGSKKYVGAILIAALACIRSGSGLVYVATPSPVYKQISGIIPEVIFIEIPVKKNNQIDYIKAKNILLESINFVDSFAIGPGMNNSEESIRFLEEFLNIMGNNKTLSPIVIDADAINNLAYLDGWEKKNKNSIILTPHIDEMSRLGKIAVNKILIDKKKCAKTYAKKLNSIIVLKGANTVIASPNGLVQISPYVNSAMAKAGTGDMLTGLISGLIASDRANITHENNLFYKSCLGVYIQGFAANIAKKEIGETAVKTTDIIERLGLFHKKFFQ
ncbi:MAG: NAD(P)H-hydrate dehydratase [Dehalococcoidia bacterium]